MTRTVINGFGMNWEEFGAGEPLVITAGINTSLEHVRGVGEGLAAHYRVILWDRRNYGASDVSFPESSLSEAQIWAEDLHALLQARGGEPAWVAGFSLGAGASLLMALRHPEAVRGLMLAWVAGGPFPRDDFVTSDGIPRPGLVRRMYGDYIAAAKRGGMEAVAETPWFRDRIAQNPGNRELLLSTPVARFLDTMERWEALFRVENAFPPLGPSELEQLASMTKPTHIISGDDHVHPISAAKDLHALIPQSEYCPPLLSHKEWYALAAKGHAGISGFRGKHVPPVWLEFLRRCHDTAT